MFKPPNWNDAEAYPTPGKASNAAFAWEFLRRNAAYQSAWGAYLAKLYEAAGSSEELLSYVACLTAPEEAAGVLCAPFRDPSRANAAAFGLFSSQCLNVNEEQGNSRKTVRPLMRQMGHEWGLEAMANPARGYGLMHCRFLARKGTIEPTSYGLARLEEEHQANRTPGLQHSKWLVLQIDLEQPLRVIQEATMWAIKSNRNYRKSQGWIKPIESRARAPDLLVHYLRILDARLQGVAIARIGEVLKPDDLNHSPEYGRDKAIKAAMRAAEALRDGGYRLLPLLEDKLPAWPTS